MMSGTAAYCCRSVHHQVTKQYTMCWYILIIRGKALPERCWNVSKKNIRTTYISRECQRTKRMSRSMKSTAFSGWSMVRPSKFATILINAKIKRRLSYENRNPL